MRLAGDALVIEARTLPSGPRYTAIELPHGEGRASEAMAPRSGARSPA